MFCSYIVSVTMRNGPKTLCAEQMSALERFELFLQVLADKMISSLSFTLEVFIAVETRAIKTSRALARDWLLDSACASFIILPLKLE